MATDKYIRIHLDSQGANTGVRKLERNMKGLETQSDKVAFSMTKIASAVAGVIAAGQLTKFFTDSAKTSTLFGAAVAELGAITGATGDDLQFLSNSARELGKTSTLSATQAATAFKLIASAKPDLLENLDALKAVTEQTVLLAEASGNDLANAAQIVGSSLNQFAEDADQAARFVNVLAAGSKFGASEVFETGVALKNAGVAARSAGVGFETTNAAIQILAENAIKGGEAGTALRNILARLDTAADSNLRPSVVGLSQALKNMRDQGLGTTEMMKFFGLENKDAAKILVENVDNLDLLTEKLTGTNTAADQASARFNTLDGDLKQLNSAFEDTQIAIGQSFDAPLRSATQTLTEFLRETDAVGDVLVPAFETATTAVEILAIVIGAKLVTALGQSTVALTVQALAATRSSVQMNAMGVVIARNTVLTRTATVATAGLTRAMALLGGPVGVIALVAFGLYSLASSQETAEEAAVKHTEAVEKETTAIKKLGEEDRKTRLELLKSEQLKLQASIETLEASKAKFREMQIEATQSTRVAGSGFDFMSQKIASTIDKIEESQKRLSVLKDTIKEFNAAATGPGQTSSQPAAVAQSASAPASAAPSADTSFSSQSKKDFVSGIQQNTEDLQRELELRQQITAIHQAGQLSSSASFFEMQRAQQQVGELEALANLESSFVEREVRQQRHSDRIAEQIAESQARATEAINAEAVKLAEQEGITDEQKLEIIRNRDLLIQEQKIAHNMQMQILDLEQSEQEKILQQLKEEELTTIAEQGAEKRMAISNKEFASQINSFQSYANASLNVANAFGSKSEKANKKRRKTAVVIDTAAGIGRAFAENSFYEAIPIAALIGLNGLAQIKAINSAGSGSSSIGSSATSGGGISASSAPRQPAIPVRETVEIRGLDQVLDFMETNRGGLMPVEHAELIVRSIDEYRRQGGQNG